MLKAYFAEHDHNGFAYAYQYLGLNRVMQAARRVFRTEQDRGIILLIDERLTQARYTRLFPPHGGISRWCGLTITFKISYAISGGRIARDRQPQVS